MERYARNRSLVAPDPAFLNKTLREELYFYGNLMLGDLRFFRSDASTRKAPQTLHLVVKRCSVARSPTSQK